MNESPRKDSLSPRKSPRKPPRKSPRKRKGKVKIPEKKKDTWWVFKPYDDEKQRTKVM